MLDKGKYPREASYTEKTHKLLEKDDYFISPSYTRDYRAMMVGGRGREVIDIDGNYYLDFGAGIATTSTGHCHPKVVRAIQRQSERLIHLSGTDFFYPSQVELAEKLAKKFRAGYNMAFFGNSGAEAIEAAMKLSRFYTQRPAYLAFTGAFHGRTLGALSLTGSKATQRRYYSPLQPTVHVPYPDCDRCAFNSKGSECEQCGRSHCIAYIEEEVLEKVLPVEDIAAVFIEPIQGEGGYIVPEYFWWTDFQKMLKRHDLLLVVDEVQAGMGRTGKWFAHQHFNIEPDMITLAKGIASGMPLGVMLADNFIMSEWDSGSHASTFGGNPVSCAAALATIDVIESEELMKNAEECGQYLHELLTRLASDHECVVRPRGLGLMRAIDIEVPGKDALANSQRDFILKKCFDCGLILLGCGKSGIRFCPALNVTKEEIDVCIDILDSAIRK